MFFSKLLGYLELKWLLNDLFRNSLLIYKLPIQTCILKFFVNKLTIIVLPAISLYRYTFLL